MSTRPVAATETLTAALKEFKRVIPGKQVPYTSHVAEDRIPVQVALGPAAAEIHAAELVMCKMADDICSARPGTSVRRTCTPCSCTTPVPRFTGGSCWGKTPTRRLYELH